MVILRKTTFLLLGCFGFGGLVFGAWWWHSVSTSAQPSTVATQWQWDGFDRDEVTAAWERAQQTSSRTVAATGQQDIPSTEQAEQKVEVSFDVVGIYQALGEVELDANGDLVLDDRARVELEQAFKHLPDTMSEAQLTELQELIRVGLPGSAGQQTAAIVENFYHFRVAEQALHETLPKPETPAEALAQYEQIVTLRETHLGADTASELYRQEQSHTRYTYQYMAIQTDSTLSEEEKQQQFQQLRESVAEQLPSVNDPYASLTQKEAELRQQGASNEELYALRVEMLGKKEAEQLQQQDAKEREWQQRYQAYHREKQYILDAGLATADERRAIDDLLAKYFEPEELAAARAYDAGQSQ